MNGLETIASGQIEAVLRGCKKYPEQLVTSSGAILLFHEMLWWNTIVLESMLTCPHCGCAKPETMPVDACQFFYECSQCETLLSPRPGDCCVFCSFGSVRCPPVQQERGCCG